MRIRSLLKKYKFLLLIIVLASLLRLIKLTTAPPHLTADEASLGYNAYSLLTTGKDMWGTSYPMIFKSFGDYTPGLYIYLTVPFVALLGLTELAVRLPNALSGIMIVYLIYQISKMIFSNLEVKNRETISLCAAGLAAINPWLISFSRGAWLPNFALALTLAAIFFFLKSLYEAKYLIISAVFFAFTLLSYQGAKMTTLIVVLLLGTLFIQQILKMKKYVLVSLLIALLISSPIILSMINGTASRLSVVSVFSYPRTEVVVENILKEDNNPEVSYYALHSEMFNYLRVIMGKWFNHFSARFLFFEGDWENPRFSSPYLGELLFVESLLIILGLGKALRAGKNKYLLFILAWLLIAPLPAILSRDQVHAARSLNMVISLVVLEALGLNFLIGRAKVQNSFKLLMVVFSGLYVLNYAYYFDSYFVHLPKAHAKHWDYGYREAVNYLTDLSDQSRPIVFQQSYEQPFIFFLFYQKISPEVFLQSTQYQGSSVGDVGLVQNLGRISFRGLSAPFTFPSGTIVVADPVAAPADLMQNSFTTLKEIRYPGEGNVALRVFEAK